MKVFVSILLLFNLLNVVVTQASLEDPLLAEHVLPMFHLLNMLYFLLIHHLFLAAEKNWPVQLSVTRMILIVEQIYVVYDTISLLDLRNQIDE